MNKLLPLLAILIALVAVTPAWAVDATCDSLQNELTNQPAGTTITLQADGGLCDGNYTANKEFVLEGEPGAGFQPDADIDGRSLEWSANAGTLTLRNLIFLGSTDNDSDAGGAELYVEGDIIIENNTFRGIHYGDDGSEGGALSALGLDITLTDNTFGGPAAADGNTTTFSGGGALVEAYGTATLDGNTFTSNVAALSGGGARVDGRRAVIVDNTFTDNSSSLVTGGGLALTVRDDADGTGTRAVQPGDDNPDFDANLARNTFSSNSASIAGGGLLIGKTGDGAYDENPFSCCPEARDQVGGFFFYTGGDSPEIRLDHNVYDLNEAGGGFIPASGGGAQLFGVNADSYSERYTRNEVHEVQQEGPGDRQEAGGEGGGLSVTGTSNGEVGDREAAFTGVNLVVAGNAIGEFGEGGGIYIGVQDQCFQGEGEAQSRASSCSTRLDLVHATVAGNVVNGTGDGAGIASDPDDDIAIFNSIVWGNRDTNDESVTEDMLVNVQNTLVRHSDVCLDEQPWPDEDEEPSNICEDPKLAGPTKAQGADVHQTAASPTIDRVKHIEPLSARTAADMFDVEEDYEDDPRPILVSNRSATPYDMGADEYINADFGVAITDSPDPVGEGGVLTYTVTADNTGPVAAPALVVTVTLPFAATSVPEGCTGTTTIVCNIGTLAVGASKVLTFVVSPNKAGDFPATAAITGGIDDPTSEDHNASTTTKVTARPAGGGYILPDQTKKKCISRRKFTIRIRKLRFSKKVGRNDRIVSAVVRVAGKKVKVRKGRRLTATINLTGRPRQRVTVTIVAKTRKGKTIRGKRVYRTCTPKRNDTTPPPI